MIGYDYIGLSRTSLNCIEWDRVEVDVMDDKRVDQRGM
jgi:hypothetical protein